MMYAIDIQKVCYVEPVAYLDGEYVPASAARLPVWDLGVVGGIAVSEMLRTFRHQPFQIEWHLDRLIQSLELARIPSPVSREEWRVILQRVADQNLSLISPDDDLGIILFVTAGWNPTYVGREVAGQNRSTVGVHTFPLQYQQWGSSFHDGVRLRVSPVPALSRRVVDRRIKARSRLHWHVAQQTVSEIDPGAIALLQDEDGCITETAAANVCIVRGGTIISPPAGTVLEGVSLQTTLQLAEKMAIPSKRYPLRAEDLHNADEIFLTSTPCCLLPVTQFNGNPVGTGCPGEMFERLLQSWCELVGMDVRHQATRNSRI